jgi:adenylate kinase family enzyme
MKEIIIGNAGSGKTWLARRLADGIDTPTVHLDELFWEPGGFDVKRDQEEVDRLIEESKRTASWVVEGVFGELAERYFAEAELLIWLDIDWETCKTRLLARGSESKRHLGREQSEEGLKRLVDWASHYYDRGDLRSFLGHRALMEKFPGKTLRLTSEEEVNRVALNDLSPP